MCVVCIGHTPVRMALDYDPVTHAKVAMIENYNIEPDIDTYFYVSRESIRVNGFKEATFPHVVKYIKRDTFSNEYFGCIRRCIDSIKILSTQQCNSFISHYSGTLVVSNSVPFEDVIDMYVADELEKVSDDNSLRAPGAVVPAPADTQDELLNAIINFLAHLAFHETTYRCDSKYGGGVAIISEYTDFKPYGGLRCIL